MEQRLLVKSHHKWLCEHNGVDCTLDQLIQWHPKVLVSTKVWRQWIYSKLLHAKRRSRDTKLWGHHALVIDFKVHVENHLTQQAQWKSPKRFRYIFVMIDIFTRYVKIFPTKVVTATAVTDALWRDLFRFSTPLEIMTDCGSQFMNQTLCKFAVLTSVRHHYTIPYSKEENGSVERSNKEVNWLISNILADNDYVKNWPQMLCMAENIPKFPVKQPLGASLKTLLFGSYIIQDPIIIQEMKSATRQTDETLGKNTEAATIGTSGTNSFTTTRTLRLCRPSGWTKHFLPGRYLSVRAEFLLCIRWKNSNYFWIQRSDDNDG